MNYRILGMIMMLAAGTAYAAGGSGVDGGTRVGVEFDLERAATASPDEMRTEGKKALESITKDKNAISKMVDDAKGRSDAALLQCLVPKFTSVQALEQVAKTSLATMSDALVDFAKNEKTARYHFRVLGMSANRSAAIRNAAENCDDRSSFSGETIREVVGGTGDDNDTEDDEPYRDIDIGFDPPPPTPFRESDLNPNP